MGAFRTARGEDGLPRAAPSASWTSEDLLAAVRALAERRVPADRKLDHYCGQLANEIWRRQMKPPTDLVRRLIESERPDLRWCGLRLVLWGSDIRPDEVRGMALSDPSAGIRSAALDACGRLLLHHPGLADVVAAAAQDGSASVRERCVSWLRFHATRAHPGFAPLVVAATRDPDPGVRRAAISALGAAGKEGAARAVDMIRAGEYDRDGLEALVSTATYRGYGAQLLGTDPSPEVVTVLIDALNGDETGETARALRGRFRELLPLYQPAGDGDHDTFFDRAAEAGEFELLGEVVTDRGRSSRIRLSALESGLEAEGARRSTVSAAWTVIRDRKNPSRLRAQVLEMVLDEIRGDGEWEGELRGLLRDAASDPSIWVRQRAEEALRDLNAEDED
jgi:HEAT repeat protein